MTYASTETKHKVIITSDGNNDFGPNYRDERLNRVNGHLRRKLNDRQYRRIYSLHDHKGTLVVKLWGEICADDWKILKAIDRAWFHEGEVLTEIHVHDTYKLPNAS